MSGRLRTVPVAVAVLAASAVAQTGGAQQSGVAMTAESGGKQAGCVQWSYSAEPNSRSNVPGSTRLVFRFRNDCPRTVYVTYYRQTGWTNSAGMGAVQELAPGEAYGGPRDSRFHLFFAPDKDRYLNFWVIQSDMQFSYRNNNILDMSRCNPGFKPVSNSKRVYPPCPPRFTYR